MVQKATALPRGHNLVLGVTTLFRPMALSQRPGPRPGPTATCGDRRPCPDMSTPMPIPMPIPMQARLPTRHTPGGVPGRATLGGCHDMARWPSVRVCTPIPPDLV